MQADLCEQQIKNRTDAKISDNMNKGLHSCFINHRQYIVFADVFSPVVFPSTEWFTNSLIKHLGSISSFLEIGTGIGATLIEIILAKYCAFAFGTDISQNAVDNTLANLKKYGVVLRVEQSDVFDKVDQELKFDAIYWNYPFHFKAQKSFKDMGNIERSVRDPQYTHLYKYLKNAQKYLNEKGRLFLGFSKTFGNEAKLDQIAKETGWKYKIIEETEANETLQSPIFCLIELRPFEI